MFDSNVKTCSPHNFTPDTNTSESVAHFQPRTKTKPYALDPSVLRADPGALKKFAEHGVVLPVVVISELEAKRHHPELGWFARHALRHLEGLRSQHGYLDQPVPANEQGGMLH